jgi:hypothetical protein
VADRQRRDELEGLHTLNDLAGELVVALGSSLRDQGLSVDEREAVTKALALFELMTSDDVIAVGTSVGRMLGGERSYLDALRAVEREANGSGIEEQARVYAETLKDVLERADGREMTEAARRELELKVQTLRNFFTRMSETVLTRADALSRTREESLWRWAPLPSSTF